MYLDRTAENRNDVDARSSYADTQHDSPFDSHDRASLTIMDIFNESGLDLLLHLARRAELWEPGHFWGFIFSSEAYMIWLCSILLRPGALRSPDFVPLAA